MGKSEYSQMRIYSSSTDKVGRKLLYEYLVEQAKLEDIAGATVFRGIMGYGQSSKEISTSRFWELTDKLPVTIEFADKTEKLEAFWDKIEKELLEMEKGCMVSIMPVDIKLMKPGKEK